MESNPKIVPVEGLGEAATTAQNLAIQQSVLFPTEPGTTVGMYPPPPVLFEP